MHKRKLTLKELNTLKLFSDGKTSKMIAKIENVSPITINKRAENICFKFGTVSRAQSVAEGFRTGVLVPFIIATTMSSLSGNTDIKRPYRPPATRGQRTPRKNKNATGGLNNALIIH